MKTKTIELDIKAKKLATNYIHTESQLLDVLIEMKENLSFRELNSSGIFDYCERVLKFSRAQSFYFKNVAEKSKEVPELKAAIDAGILSLSQARRIVPVLTPSNHKTWIEKARTLLQQDLEKEVAAVNPAAKPRESLKPVGAKTSKLVVEVDATTEESLKILQDILSQKTRKPADLKSVIAWMAKECREKFDPIKKAERTVSSRKQKPQKASRPGRHPIPNTVKAEVVLRDSWQCTHQGLDGKRCTQKRHIDFHHIKEVSKGGLNEAANLKLLCSRHHKMLHDDAKTPKPELSWSDFWDLESSLERRH